MLRSRFIFASILALLIALVPPAGRAADTLVLTQQAQQAVRTGHNTYALGLYEMALTESVDQPESVFGLLNGKYWTLIGKTSDFPRALDFFTALAAEQKSPGATLLASRANAIGGYLGWLQRNDLIANVPPASLQKLDATARRNYARALALDPDNFTALYGFAIYESYSPSLNSKAHMQQLLTRLNSLRASHPQYPWQLVDYLQTHGHPQI